MTAGRDDQRTRRRRPGAVWVALAAGLLAAALLIGPPPDDGDALDPEGTGPLGARGLVLLLERLGADVTATAAAPGPEVDVAVVLGDRLGEARRAEVTAWVRAGGTLVVADPGSPLVPVAPAGDLTDPEIGAAGCGIPALGDVGALAVEGVGYRLGLSDRGCLGDGDAYFATATAVGAGTVVALGGAGVWVNEALGEADNAVLAAALLAPAPGTTVAVLLRPPVGEGTASLPDLVGDGVKQGLVQLAVAFGVYAVWRARRLGRPVAEVQPVELAASELVVAVGHLWHHGRHRGRAAAVLREDLRRRLARRLGLPAGAGPAEVAEVAAARTGADPDRTAALLHPADPGSDEDLVTLATDAHDLHEELRHVR